MILFWQDDGRRLCQAQDCSLYTVQGEQVHLLAEEVLATYLQARPDTDFHLRNYLLREEMSSHAES
jgi:hypothetical protein